MPEQPNEPESSFVKFVREMSEASERLEEYEREPERVMTEAGLSEEEKDMLLRGDEEEILRVLGEAVPMHGVTVLRIIHVRLRRRRPPTKPT